MQLFLHAQLSPIQLYLHAQVGYSVATFIHSTWEL